MEHNNFKIKIYNNNNEYFQKKILRSETKCFIHNCTRYVTIHLDKNSKQILYTKAPSFEKYRDIQEKKLKYDLLAFKISQHFELHVVPATTIINNNDKLKITENTIFQKAVNLNDNQFHIQNLKTQKSNFEENFINLKNLHEAILFNLLTGRKDGRKENSVIDKNNNIQEIDNEQIGNNKTDSWLLKKKYIPIIPQFTKKIMKNFIKHDEETIERIFTEMKELGHSFDENEEDSETQGIITTNFKKIHFTFSSALETKSNVSPHELKDKL